jgi:hypothetical protein
MSLRQPHEEAILSGGEIAMIRQVLADCSQLVERAQRDAGPAAGALLAKATRAATAARRGPDGMIYHINLAIDYLDYAPAARRRP